MVHRCKKPGVPGLREQNVCAGIDQPSIMAAATSAGFTLVKETLEHPDNDVLLEGRFEVDYVLGDHSQQCLQETGCSREQEAEIQAFVQRLRYEAKRARAQVMAAIDVWCAVFELERYDPVQDIFTTTFPPLCR
ncbi:uncharacterized protein RCC_05274 [Ramularia collo-cygni]|uniref:Uncharacterized protein n=1 Tax=Ramularia collo-cygni TaxID=112498 RepID=A0A2D3VFJ7_9PEZI|nr:uncharacterized protein RCC_05274 [Ramularia collo-cygni]CZT19423.1 uncharacterized protein RCC_05274 [Ramularia collo-cygni]